MSQDMSVNIYNAIRETVLTAKNKVYTAVNFAMVEAYWGIGSRLPRRRASVLSR